MSAAVLAPSPSGMALAAAGRFPRLARTLVRLWGTRYLNHPRRQHWVFRELRARLDLAIDRQITLPTGQPLIVDAFGFIAMEIDINGCYEAGVIAAMRALLAPGMVCIDAGANVGYHTVVAAGLAGPRGQVHAFEPTPDTFRALVRNVTLSGYTNVFCRMAALSDSSADTHLYLADSPVAHSLGRTIHTSSRVIPVVSRTLDEYVEETRLARVDFLKADVEGAELLVLQGGQRTISRHRPLMILEFSEHTTAFGYDVARLAQTLEDLGYVLFTVSPRIAPYASAPPGLLYYDVLCVPRSKLDSPAVRRLLHDTTCRDGSMHAAEHEGAHGEHAEM